MKIKVFSHMNDMGAGINITKEQVSKIIDSGLINAAEFYFVTNYDQKNYDWLKEDLKEYKNINFLNLNARPDDWEMPTLEELKKHCDESDEDFYVLYIHHKGAHYQDKSNFQFVTEWRQLLEYFNIEKWRDCVAALDKTETAGINFTTQPWKHYSGNFWWARSSYIKKLPKIKRRSNPADERSQFGNYTKGWNYRWDAESWIGMADPSFTNFYNSEVDHYKHPYPSSLYRTD